MGLLGDSWDDPRTMATLQLAAGLLGGGGFGKAASRGLSGYQQTMAAAQQEAMEKQKLAMAEKLQAAQIAEYRAQAQQRQMQAMKLQQDQQRAQQFQGDLSASMAGASPADALRAGGGPTVGNAALIGQRSPINWQALAMKYPDQADAIKKMAEAANYGKSEVARTVDTTDDAGRPVTQQFDKFGSPIGGKLAKFVEAKIADTGGKLIGYDPVTGEPKYTFGKTMTPGEVASNGIAGANLQLSRSRFDFEKTQAGKPQFHDGSWVTPPNAQNPSGTAVQVPGFSKPLTEAQGNATAFGMRAKNALENLSKVDTVTNGDYYKSRLPWGTGNFMMSANGQAAMNAEKNFIAAMLRKDSGAAISQGEYKEAGDQLFPRPGDTISQLEQKAKSRDVVLAGLDVQAGQSGAAHGAAALKTLPDRSNRPKPIQPGSTLKFDANGMMVVE